MDYSFPAIISRPVTFEDDPDCQDTHAVPVIVQCEVCSDGAVIYGDCKVSADTPINVKHPEYPTGLKIRWQKYTDKNETELDRHYLISRQADAPDNIEAFPSYGADPAPAEDYDQRVNRHAA